MYLCRELTELSLPKIGQQFGGRDHTTVMHADRKIRLLMAERRSIYNQVTELTNRIKQPAPLTPGTPRQGHTAGAVRRSAAGLAPSLRFGAGWWRILSVRPRHA